MFSPLEGNVVRGRAALSLAALGIGFVWAAADEQGLTWHDRMSKTFVAQDEL